MVYTTESEPEPPKMSSNGNNGRVNTMFAGSSYSASKPSPASNRGFMNCVVSSGICADKVTIKSNRPQMSAKAAKKAIADDNKRLAAEVADAKKDLEYYQDRVVREVEKNRERAIREIEETLRLTAELDECKKSLAKEADEYKRDLAKKLAEYKRELARKHEEELERCKRELVAKVALGAIHHIP